MSESSEPDDEEVEEDSKELLEIESRSSLPAIFIDTWFLTTWRGHMRIALGETVSNQDMYRTAVVMEIKDAERLCRQMTKMIERRKRNDAARTLKEAEELLGARKPE